MVVYTCEKCNHDFARKQYLIDHKNRKTSCIKTVAQKAHFAHKNVRPKAESNTAENNPNICKFCIKSFSRPASVKRHIEYGYCEIKREQDKEKEQEKEEIFRQLITEFQNNELKTQNKELQIHIVELINQNKLLMEQQKKNYDELDKKNEQIIDLIKEVQKPKINKSKKVVNTNNGNINSNNIINNNVNIQITQFGNEDFSQIDDKYFQTIVRNPRILGFKVPEEILKIIHFNSVYPKFQNFYISDFNRKKIMVYDGKKWNLESSDKIKSVLEQIIDYGRSKLEEYREKNLSEDAIKRLKRIEDAMNKCDNDFITDLREMAEEEENNIKILEQIKIYEEFQKKVIENIKKISYNEGKLMIKKN